MRPGLQLVISIGICLAAGAIGSLANSRAALDWYATLQRPVITPPSWLFGPVWTLLYVLMGVALFLVWRRAAAGADVTPALGLFAAQLVLNVLWSPAFFGLRSPGLGLVVIVPLDVLIVLTILAFWRVAPTAGALLLPYLGWTGFATVLNAFLYTMNR